MKIVKMMLASMLMTAFVFSVVGVFAPQAAHALVIKDMTSDIKMSLKEGKTLQQAMDLVFECGRSAGEVVSAAIEAGARPEDAVYLAIKARPAEVALIMEAAVKTGARLENAVEAAKAAGAIRKDVEQGLLKAGMVLETIVKYSATFEHPSEYAYKPPVPVKSQQNNNVKKINDGGASNVNKSAAFLYIE